MVVDEKRWRDNERGEVASGVVLCSIRTVCVSEAIRVPLSPYLSKRRSFVINLYVENCKDTEAKKDRFRGEGLQRRVESEQMVPGPVSPLLAPATAAPHPTKAEQIHKREIKHVRETTNRRERKRQ